MIDIDSLIKTSMKSGDKAALRTYKNLKSEIQKFKTAKNAKPYDEATEIQIIKKYLSNLEDSISAYSQAGREDLIADCTGEKEVLIKLFPEPISSQKIEDFVFTYAEQNGFLKEDENFDEFIEFPKREMGKIIKLIKVKYPAADGKEVSNIVKKYVI